MAIVGIKSILEVANAILTKLRMSINNNRLQMFRNACFGHWLDIRLTHGDPMLVHLILQMQVFSEQHSENALVFNVGGSNLRFGREEFSLITGFRF